MALTPKQSRFVDEYLVDLNAAGAYRRAGYVAKGNAAEVNAARLLRNAQVQQAVQQRMKQREQRTQVDADYVIKRLQEIDQMDVFDILNDDMSLKPISQWPRTWRLSISGIDLSELVMGGESEQDRTVRLLKKIKWPDKVKNLELLGRHFGIFNDKLDVSGQVSVVDRILMARKRAANP